MKKLIVILGTIFISQLQAQVKEGFVKYNMEIGSDASKGMNPMSGNTDVIIYFKNEKTLMEMITPIYTMKTLMDEKGSIILMDGAGQKFFIRKTRDEMLKEKASKKMIEPVIVFTNEKKKILGYDCTKATITIDNGRGGKSTMTGWHTDKIHTGGATMGFLDAEVAAKFKGMLLEVDRKQGSISTKMTATEISMKPVPDSKFVLSTAGYVEKKATIKP